MEQRMGINPDAFPKNDDVFIDYDFEEVMFRREAATGRIFRKFYGADEEITLIDRTNRLCNLFSWPRTKVRRPEPSGRPARPCKKIARSEAG